MENSENIIWFKYVSEFRQRIKRKIVAQTILILNPSCSWLKCLDFFFSYFQPSFFLHTPLPAFSWCSLILSAPPASQLKMMALLTLQWCSLLTWNNPRAPSWICWTRAQPWPPDFLKNCRIEQQEPPTSLDSSVFYLQGLMSAWTCGSWKDNICTLGTAKAVSFALKWDLQAGLSLVLQKKDFS